MALGDFDSRWKDPQGSDAQNMFLWAQNLIKELRKGEYISNSILDGIANNELADMAESTIKGRAVGAGTGDAQDLTATQATAILNAFVGDSGSGGTKGLVPAPASGDARKFLKGDGTWASSGATLLTSGTVSAATLDIVLTAYTAYRALVFVLTSFVPVTDDVELWMRTSTDGGSTYDAGASDYAWTLTGADSNGSNLLTTDNADSEIQIAGFPSATTSISNVASEGGVDCQVTLFDPTSARFGRVYSSSAWHMAVNRNAHQQGSGARLSAANVDAVRFLFESGNITSGNYAVYGLS